MRSIGLIAMGVMFWQSAATAQTTGSTQPFNTSKTDRDTRGVAGAPPQTSDANRAATGAVGIIDPRLSPQFTPLTSSERWRMYILSTFGPEAIVRASTSAGISQWNGTPKEWGQGAEAYGERFGNSFAQHVIFKTMEAGAAAALHEDNRYTQSSETVFWKRMKHAVGSTFVARNDAGDPHFAYSRVGSAAGAAFISRVWQPPSVGSAGDGAVSFGISMGFEVGWNIFREFAPRRFKRF
jgi:hypothetical protein